MTNRPMTNTCSRRPTVAAALLALLAAMPPADAAAEQAGERLAPVPAIWKPQEINFYLHTTTSIYSCRSVADQVRRVLLALGVEPGVTVRSSGCYDNELTRTPYLRIKLVSPVEATPQALAALEKSRSTRELVARVKGESPIELTGQFPAQWSKVSLSRGQLGLQEGDCELIDELKRIVLPKLAVRVVNDDMKCMPYSLTMGQPRLEVEALTQMPEPSVDEAVAPR